MTVNNATHPGKVCNGLLMPILDERDWDTGVRAFLYLLGLLYSFFGVSIVADVFMCSIEKITSKTKKVKVKDTDLDVGEIDLHNSEGRVQYKEVLVWNPTVANLTLMALGSSAPEILLSLIEITGNRFVAGKLGPSTIVGSAAFNLLCITAICIISIKTPESKKIQETMVFTITATSCVFAYIWLLIILKVSSPNIIESWEAFVTLVFFVILIIIAFIADKKFCCKKKASSDVIIRSNVVSPVPTPLTHVETPEGEYGNGTINDEQILVTKAEMEGGMKMEEYNTPNGQHTTPNSAHHINNGEGVRKRSELRTPRPISGKSIGIRWLDIEREVAQQHPGASAETLAKITAQRLEAMRPHSRLYYRINVTRWLSAAKQNLKGVSPTDKDKPQFLGQPELRSGRPGTAASSAFRAQSAVPVEKLSIIEFVASRYSVSEAEGHVLVKVHRLGRAHKRILFKYETLDGTATAGSDYLSQTETLVFNPNESEKMINIQICPNAGREPDEVFYVKLGLEDFADGATMIGHNSVATINIANNDKETKIQFPQNALVVKENVGTVQIPVVRRGNPREMVGVRWTTVDGTAVSGTDFYGGSGVVVFDKGEIEKNIQITVIDDKEFEKHESFEIHLSDPSGEATLSSKKKRCVLTILNDDEMTLLLTQSDKLVPKQLEALQPGAQTWRQQFVQAANVNGGDLDEASGMDYVVHILGFAWKILFACVPPPVYLGGWLTFSVALMLIGLLTAIVGDFAGIFGCLVGLEDSVTAITLVALGTSLPDLFASRLAATSEPTADNSVGNVTGSNSVNVFLGLGLSWLVAAIYWERKGEQFSVPAGSLSFSVTIYTIMSLCCIALLVVRRKMGVFGWGELGGPKVSKWLCGSFLIFLWCLYVFLSILEAYKIIPGF